MRFFIYAYEKVYGSNYGVYEFDIVNTNSAEDANLIGRDMAIDLIEANDVLMGIFEAEADLIGAENSYEWEEALDKAIEDDAEWTVYQIDESKAHGIQDWVICATYTGDPDELDEFIKRWCIPDN